MQLILSLFSLQSTVFTSLKTIFLSTCSCVSPRVKQKRLQFGVTIGTCADSYQQNKTVFLEKWTISSGRETENVCRYTLFSGFSAFFGSLYRGGLPGRFSLSGKHKDSPHPSHQPSQTVMSLMWKNLPAFTCAQTLNNHVATVVASSQAFATFKNSPLPISWCTIVCDMWG